MIAPNMNTEPMIDDIYNFYMGVFKKARPDSALGLPLAHVLWEILEEWRPARILDLGSGFSSAVFRYWSRGRDTVVYSVDKSHEFLAQTMLLLELLELPTEHCMTLDVFIQIPRLSMWFDLILVDHDKMAQRVRDLAAWIPDLLCPGGIIVLDDWNHSDYARDAAKVLEERQFLVSPFAEVRDQFGRFLATAT